jgi:hypothetical protein
VYKSPDQDLRISRVRSTNFRERDDDTEQDEDFNKRSKKNKELASHLDVPRNEARNKRDKERKSLAKQSANNMALETERSSNYNTARTNTRLDHSNGPKAGEEAFLKQHKTKFIKGLSKTPIISNDTHFTDIEKRLMKKDDLIVDKIKKDIAEDLDLGTDELFVNENEKRAGIHNIMQLFKDHKYIERS